MKKNQNTLGILSGVVSALCVSGYFTINKYIYAHYAIGAFEYSMLFALMGGLFGLLSLVGSANRETYQEIRSNIRSLLILGSVVFIAVGILIFGLRYTSAINAALLSTSTIVTTILFSHFLLNEKLSKKQWGWIATLFTGLYIAIVGVRTIHLQAGDLIILSAVIFFGFGNAYNRVIMKRVKRPSMVADVRIIIGALFAGITSLSILHGYTVPIKVLPWALLAGFFYWLCIKTFATAVHLINANEAVVLNNSHVFFTSITGVLILGEHYTAEKFLGSIIIIASVYFIAAHKKLTAPPA